MTTNRAGSPSANQTQAATRRPRLSTCKGCCQHSHPPYASMQQCAVGSCPHRGIVLEDPQPQAFGEVAGNADEGHGGCWSWLCSVLLPRGFPDSVAPEYMQYQLWDTLQVMMADLRSILISNAGLIGAGVGVVGATPLGTMWVDFQVELFSTCQGLVIGGESSVCTGRCS